MKWRSETSIFGRLNGAGENSIDTAAKTDCLSNNAKYAAETGTNF
jgi:hypothetical protein